MSDDDLFGANGPERAQAALATARAECPVREITLPNGTRAWHFTRHDDIRRAFTDPHLIKRPTGGRMAEGDTEALAYLKASTWHMLNANPPEHTRMRRLVQKAFTRRRIEGLEPRIQLMADELLDQITPGEVTDLLPALALPIPIQVICELLGVPVEDQAKFRAWSEIIVASAFGDQNLVPALRDFVPYIRGLIADKRREPGDDLLSALANLPEDDRLAEDQLSSMVYLLLIGGHETTVNLIGNGIYTLLTHPDQLALLRANRDLLPNAIEEMLRYESAVQTATVRFAAEPVEYGGVTVPKKAPVFLSVMSANRDPDRVERPDEFDITRQDIQHMAFGHGIHFCLGAPLARLEARIAIGSLLDRFEDISLAVPAEELGWRPSVLFHGLKSLPVVVKSR
jgi:cytochrome P450